MAFFMMIYFSYLMFYPIEVIKADSNNLSTVESEYLAGEQLTQYIHVTKYYPIVAEISEAFVDGIVFQLPSRTGNFPIGRYDTIDRSVHIPESIPSGYYYLETTVRFRINHFREITYRSKSNKFKITNEIKDRLGLKELTLGANQ